jgi:hypothetical protein
MRFAEEFTNRVTNSDKAAVGYEPCFSAAGHTLNIRKRRSTARGSGGRFAAERDLYRLPTGRKFESAEEIFTLL